MPEQPLDGPLTAGPDAIYNAAQLLTTLEEGQFNADLSSEIEDLARDLHARIEAGTKGAGEITIKIKLTADKGVLEVTADYKIKSPPVARRRTIMHIAGGRFLSRRDPRQPELPLRTVSNNPAQADLRTVSQS